MARQNPSAPSFNLRRNSNAWLSAVTLAGPYAGAAVAAVLAESQAAKAPINRRTARMSGFYQ